MSKGYYITIKESISTPVNIEAEDKLEQQIKLRSILPKDQMKELFKNAILELGFIEKEGLFIRLDENGEEQIIDLEELKLTVQLQRSEQEMRLLSEEKRITLEKRSEQENIKQQLKKNLQDKIDETCLLRLRLLLLLQ